MLGVILPTNKKLTKSWYHYTVSKHCSDKRMFQVFDPLSCFLEVFTSRVCKISWKKDLSTWVTAEKYNLCLVVTSILHLACSHSSFKHCVLGPIVLFNCPLCIMRNESQEQFIECMPGFNLHSHCNEERYKEHDSTCECNYFLRCKLNLVFWEFRCVVAIWQKAHDGSYGTANHDQEVDDKDDVKTLISWTYSWPSPLTEL